MHIYVYKYLHIHTHTEHTEQDIDISSFLIISDLPTMCKKSYMLPHLIFKQPLNLNKISIHLCK